MSLVAKVRRRIKKSTLQYGVVATIGRCVAWPAMYLGWRLVEMSPSERRRRRLGEEFDATFDVDTERSRFSEWNADIDSPNWAEGVGYDPTPAKTVRKALGMLPIAFEEYAFIDLGSGKGRVPLVATEFPFHEVIGVEYAPDLHEVAERNIAAYSNPDQRCRRVRSVCHDAAAYPFPERPLVLFFAHPFGESVIEKFLEGIDETLTRAPRKIYLIYYDPICGDMFRGGRFREFTSCDLPNKTILPRFFYTRLRWFELIGFRNREGKEFVIFESTPE
jgi:SAM-dependent methyltransferase